MDEGEAAFAERPNSLKQLRACRRCKLIKTLEQFSESFCDNCWAEWAGGENASSLKRGVRHDAAMDNTTTDFEGAVAMMRPDDSWVARWLRMKREMDDGAVKSFKAGLYAIALPGEAGEEVRAVLGENDYDEDEEEEEEGGAGGEGAEEAPAEEDEA